MGRVAGLVDRERPAVGQAQQHLSAGGGHHPAEELNAARASEVADPGAAVAAGAQLDDAAYADLPGKAARVAQRLHGRLALHHAQDVVRPVGADDRALHGLRLRCGGHSEQGHQGEKRETGLG